MYWSKCGFAAVATAFVTCTMAFAQTPDYSNVGRVPTNEEVRAWNIAIGPSGKELPPGSGTASQGAKIFAAKCEMCHGPDANGSPAAPKLYGGQGTLTTLQPVRAIGAYWPFATTIWDYIHRAMPRNQEGSLRPDEIYSLTAFILYRNGIVKEDEVMDAKSLPKVQMPNRNGFIPERFQDIPDLKKRGCDTGHCP